jgi:hypothetical protein
MRCKGLQWGNERESHTGWGLSLQSTIFFSLSLSLFFILSIMLLFFYYYYSFIYMCVHCLGHFSLRPFFPAFFLPSLPGRTFSTLISNFVEQKT